MRFKPPEQIETISIFRCLVIVSCAPPTLTRKMMKKALKTTTPNTDMMTSMVKKATTESAPQMRLTCIKDRIPHRDLNLKSVKGL